jgi:hypothetical protein
MNDYKVDTLFSDCTKSDLKAIKDMLGSAVNAKFEKEIKGEIESQKNTYYEREMYDEITLRKGLLNKGFIMGLQWILDMREIIDRELEDREEIEKLQKKEK